MIRTGRRCVGVRRFHHRFAGEQPSKTGPIEFAWEDGSQSTVDVGSDWVLTVSDERWADPFAHASLQERTLLASEVGLWEADDRPPEVAPAVGRLLTDVSATLSEVDEVVGVRMDFEGLVITAQVDEGELDVVVS